MNGFINVFRHMIQATLKHANTPLSLFPLSLSRERMGEELSSEKETIPEELPNIWDYLQSEPLSMLAAGWHNFHGF